MSLPAVFPIRRTAHCFSFMPANDMKESVFGHRKFPRIRGSIPILLALEASALTTELPRYLKYMFDTSLLEINVCVLLTGQHKAK